MNNIAIIFSPFFDRDYNRIWSVLKIIAIISGPSLYHIGYMCMRWFRTQVKVRHMALADYKNKKGLLASIIGVFCDCEYITDDDGFDSKLNFRLPFYTLLGTIFIGSRDFLVKKHFRQQRVCHQHRIVSPKPRKRGFLEVQNRW